MKIGILTFHSSCNFGANLQALATQQTVKRLGADPVVIDYYDEPKHEVYTRTISPAQYSKHQEFCQKHLVLSPRLISNQEVQQYCCEELDAVLVGSDAVFRTAATIDPRRLWKRIKGKNDALQYTSTSELSPYFLPWDRPANASVKKFSIAASCTATPFHWLSRSMLKKLATSFNDFDYLTVRDQWTQLMVRWTTWGQSTSEICPDPVFSLPAGLEWRHERWQERDLSNTILLSAIGDRAWMKAFQIAARNRGLEIGNLPNPDRDFAFDFSDVTLSLPLSPLEWFSILGQCRGFLGMRFHALVSCLANHTPAISMDLGSRFHPTYRLGSKYRDLCLRAGLMDRYFTQKQLLKQRPDLILDRLLDRSRQDVANEFADSSAGDFESKVHALMERVS